MTTEHDDDEHPSREEIEAVMQEMAAKGYLRDTGRRRNGQIVWDNGNVRAPRSSLSTVQGLFTNATKQNNTEITMAMNEEFYATRDVEAMVLLIKNIHGKWITVVDPAVVHQELDLWEGDELLIMLTRRDGQWSVHAGYSEVESAFGGLLEENAEMEMRIHEYFKQRIPKSLG